jgi:D-alanyl-lipoteichoic acid acyltransferase DltB (MBOAT superfamily)
MAWRAELVLLIVATVGVNYVAARLLAANHRRKLVLAVCMAINFALLFIFKYFGFFTDSIVAVARWAGAEISRPAFDILLPMGISFYTFQAAAYTIDVYREKYAAQISFINVLLFIMFFPQLVAGPIERADKLMDQLLDHSIKPRLDNLGAGAKFLLLGFFKKAVVADRLADCVNAVYNRPDSFTGLAYVVATLFFAVQIYCDFSGYSDIAIGSAKLLGVDLTQNFRQPYLSAGIREFWRRWHITLSSWLRDYIYIPLGGGRVSRVKRYANIMITFLASGLWHGANWTFVVWGGMHGALQVAEDALFAKTRHVPKVLTPLAIAITFVLVCVTWIFFRANNVSDAILILTHLTSDSARWGDWRYVLDVLSSMSSNLLDILINIMLCAAIAAIDLIAWQTDFIARVGKMPSLIRVVVYSVLLIMIMALAKFYSAGDFIYFQF